MADTQTNRKPFDGRVYVIVLDDLDVSAMRSTALKDAARKFVREFMGANDLAAVVYTSGRKDAAQEFTTNRELLIAAIDKFIGQRMRSLSLERLDSYYQTDRVRLYLAETLRIQSTGSINHAGSGGLRPGVGSDGARAGTRALTVLDTLKNTAEFLGSVRGRRKALLFFSEGLDYPIRDVFGAHDATMVIRASQDAISMAARANVNFYAVDPRGLAGMTTDFIEGAGLASGAGTPGPILLVPGRNTPANGITGASGGTFDVQDELRQEFRTSQDTLRELTEETGGFATLDTNNVAPAFERIVNANSRYYLLGYYPPTHPRDGRFHKIEVRVKRPNLRVEARKGYASPRGRTPEERKRDEEARLARDARRPDGQQNVDAVADRVGESDPSERSHVHGAGRAVQEHRERGVDRPGRRARRRASSRTASRMRRARSPTRSSCPSSASTPRARRSRRPGPSSISRSGPKRAIE